MSLHSIQWRVAVSSEYEVFAIHGPQQHYNIHDRWPCPRRSLLETTHTHNTYTQSVWGEATLQKKKKQHSKSLILVFLGRAFRWCVNITQCRDTIASRPLRSIEWKKYANKFSTDFVGGKYPRHCFVHSAHWIRAQRNSNWIICIVNASCDLCSAHDSLHSLTENF